MKVPLHNRKEVFVDGYHPPTNTVYEFMGCNFHGCLKCHPDRRTIKRYCHPSQNGGGSV